MTTETTAPVLDARALPVDDFTASDLARIHLAQDLLQALWVAEGALLTLGEDTAVAGDYVAQALSLQSSVAAGVIPAAVIAERVRGTSWERIGKAFRLSAEEAEAKWGQGVEDWQSQTKVQSLLRRNPAYDLGRVDEYAATGRTSRRFDGRQPLIQVLDVAAPQTGRDVQAADQAFAGTATCTHCHR